MWMWFEDTRVDACRLVAPRQMSSSLADAQALDLRGQRRRAEKVSRPFAGWQEGASTISCTLSGAECDGGRCRRKPRSSREFKSAPCFPHSELVGLMQS